MQLRKIRISVAKCVIVLDKATHKRQNRGELWQKQHIIHARQQAG